jgi:hypothetical protein
MTRNPDEWTPAVGWRDVSVHMLIRGVIAWGIMYVVLAWLASWHRGGDGVMPTFRIQLFIVAASGMVTGPLMSIRVVSATGVVNHLLLFVVAATLWIGAMLIQLILGATSLSGHVDATMFQLIALAGALFATPILLKDF